TDRPQAAAADIVPGAGPGGVRGSEVRGRAGRGGPAVELRPAEYADGHRHPAMCESGASVAVPSGVAPLLHRAVGPALFIPRTLPPANAMPPCAPGVRLPRHRARSAPGDAAPPARRLGALSSAGAPRWRLLSGETDLARSGPTRRSAGEGSARRGLLSPGRGRISERAAAPASFWRAAVKASPSGASGAAGVTPAAGPRGLSPGRVFGASAVPQRHRPK